MAQPTSLHEAAQNPRLEINNERRIRVEYWCGGEKKYHRHYSRISTAVPTACKHIIEHGIVGDYVVVKHAEYDFFIAHIDVHAGGIQMEWDEDLLRHKITKSGKVKVSK